MRTEEVQVGMEFSAVDFCSYWVTVEALDGPHALCRYNTCFSGGREKVKLVQLVDERVFERTK